MVDPSHLTTTPEWGISLGRSLRKRRRRLYPFLFSGIPFFQKKVAMSSDLPLECVMHALTQRLSIRWEVLLLEGSSEAKSVFNMADIDVINKVSRA
ncbi:hypothetical protein PISMIDRAFT_538360 [Pisolithus microcarpus 441]|uniref:Uncharacterized protein n=1 Tax=Pisolithus microcarpus 441 TaxID=765257 RepID=A0A0C9ZGM5_9AGAM|nr:hypothetical protein PISMIDRAFT_538360 [Pisolithus microcarpus 441]